MKRFFLYFLIKVLAGAVLWFYLRLMQGVEIKGKKSIPLGRPVIFYSNHPSALDPLFILTLGFWPQIIRHPEILPWPLAAEEVMKRFKLSWLLDYGCLPIRRGRGGAEVFHQAAAKLRQNQNILIFPEGERTGQEGLDKLKGGIFVLWSLCPDVYFIPVKVSGTSRVFPPKTFWPRWCEQTIRISFGRRFLVGPDFRQGKKKEFLEMLSGLWNKT